MASDELNVLAARLSLVALLLVASVMSVAAYQHYQFDKNYYTHIEMAEDAGTPAELVERLEDARAGLERTGYGGGQYAYVWKTAQTNATEQKRLLDSHIRQARNIQGASGTSASVKFLDYRERLMENKPAIDVYGWWWHQLPPGLNVLMSSVALTMFGFASILFSFVFFASMNELAEGRSAWRALVKGA